MPAPLELAAFELELEVTLGQLLVRVAVCRPAAAVPDDDAAGAILAFGNAALELGVIERMVLDMHREALVLWRQARAPGDGPALQDAVELEAQVVVQTARGVLVHDEQLPGLAAQFAARLRAAREVALAMVVAQRRRCHDRSRQPAFFMRALPLRAPRAAPLGDFLPSPAAFSPSTL